MKIFVLAMDRSENGFLYLKDKPKKSELQKLMKDLFGKISMEVHKERGYEFFR